MPSSYKQPSPRTRAITVRVPGATLVKLMRARRSSSQSELINSLLSEEEERLAAEQVLRKTSKTARKSDIDERLL